MLGLRNRYEVVKLSLLQLIANCIQLVKALLLFQLNTASESKYPVMVCITKWRNARIIREKY